MFKVKNKDNKSISMQVAVFGQVTIHWENDHGHVHD